jgi:hypothetical protein
MTEGQRADNRARLMSRLLPASVAAASLAAAAMAGSAGATNWMAKAALGIVLAGGTSAAYVHASHPLQGNVSSRQTLSSPRPSTARPLAAAAAAPSLESPHLAPAIPSSVTQVLGMRRTKRSPAPVAPPPSASLAVEVELMHDVDAALKSGHPEHAVTLLDEHRDGDGGYMQEERAAARVFAVCQMGRIDSARAAASRFLRERPHSPLAARVRASCAPPEESFSPRKPR